MVESEGGVEHMKKDSINLFPTRRSTLLFHMRTNIIERDAAATAGNFMEPSRLTFFCCLPIHHYHRIGFLSLLWLLIIMTDTWHFYTSLVKFVPNKISGIKPTPSFVITRAREFRVWVFFRNTLSPLIWKVRRTSSQSELTPDGVQLKNALTQQDKIRESINEQFYSFFSYKKKFTNCFSERCWLWWCMLFNLTDH